MRKAVLNLNIKEDSIKQEIDKLYCTNVKTTNIFHQRPYDSVYFHGTLHLFSLTEFKV